MPDAPETPTPDAAGTAPSSGSTANIKPGMTEQEIRDAGVAIDVPFESGSPEPERLRYADLGKTWTPPDDWPPDAGQSQDEQTATATGDAAAGEETTPPEAPAGA
jgi:hypothetical protein